MFNVATPEIIASFRKIQRTAGGNIPPLRWIMSRKKHCIVGASRKINEVSRERSMSHVIDGGGKVSWSKRLPDC